MAFINISIEHRVHYNKLSATETTIARDYAILRKEANKTPEKSKQRGCWSRIAGKGRNGFAGSGTSVYRMTHPALDGGKVVYDVEVERWADGRTFYATTHQITYCISSDQSPVTDGVV